MVEARNHADTLIYTAEKTLVDAGDKVSDDDKKPVADAIAALKEKKDSEDIDELTKLTDDLNTKLMKVGEQMYKEEAEKKPEDSADNDKKADEETGKKTDEKDKEAEEGEVVDDKENTK